MESVITKLVTDDANMFFGNRTFFLDSPVLEATLRYIAIKHHTGDLETVQLIKTFFTECSNGSMSVNDYLRAVTPQTLCVFWVRRGYEFPRADETGWTALDTPPFPVAPFLSKASETKVYLDADKQKVVIFVKTITEKWIDLLCSTLFRVLPWIYQDNASISQDESELFRNFVQKNVDCEKFKKIVEEPVKDFDFKAACMKRTLMNWGKTSIEGQIATLTSKSDDVRESIGTTERNLAALYTKLGNLMTNINALRATQDEDDDSVYRFFANRKQLALYKVENRTDSYGAHNSILYFSITDTVEFYDAEEFKRVFNNPHSYLGKSQDIRDLFWGLYGANKGAVRVESIFKLTNLFSLEVVRGVRTGAYTATHLPHPHQYNYGCLGANSTYIQRYMSEGNWDMAIDQAIASVKNINFGDSTVMETYVRSFEKNMDSCRCIIADNGSEMTPREFLQYVRNNENNEDTKNG